MDSAFAPGVAAWRAGAGSVRNQVRQALVARQLAAHRPPAPSRVLDVGCGQGTQAIVLARAGHAVLGVDVSDALLADAERAAAAEPAEVRARLAFAAGDLLALGRDGFDLVCCHGVVMYLPDLDGAVSALVAAARPGGLVSLLTRNQAGIALRAGLQGDWAGALAGLTARTYTNRLGLERVRADRPEDVHAALARAGADVEAWYGVRLFSDAWPEDAPVPGELDALIAAEEQAGSRDPHRMLAALTHTLARVRAARKGTV